MSLSFLSEISAANRETRFDTSDRNASRLHSFSSTVIPIVVGVLTAIFEVDFTDGALAVAVPILTSLSLALLAFVYQLRVDLKAREYPKTDDLVRLLDATFVSTTYSVVVGLLSIVFGILAGVVEFPSVAARIIHGFSFVIATHYLLILLLVLRRLYRSYRLFIR